MKVPRKERRRPRDLIRALPFFFSRRFFYLLVAASVMLLPSYAYTRSGIWLPLAADGLLVVIALVDLFTGPSPRKLRLERPVPYPFAVDKANDVFVEVTNLTGAPVSLLVFDDVPPRCGTDSLPFKAVVNPGSGTRLSYRLTPLERGDGRFGNLHFWVQGRLGLVWKRGEAEAERTVKCYPGLALIERRSIQVRRSMALDPVRALKRMGGGTDFESLREYVVGDDSRLVHWKTSARRGKLLVRQYRMERSQTVMLVLDAGRMMTARVFGKTKLDHALNAALLLGHAALELGDQVGIMVVAQDVEVFLPPSKTAAQFARILDATYAVSPKMEEPRFHRALVDISTRLTRRALVVIFTDLIDERASEGLVRYTLGLRPRHLPVVVAMSDTEVVRVADSVPEEEQDLYRVGVASELLARREQVLARLTAAGVLVVDTPPDQISAAVLDRYLEVKARNLL